MPQKRKTTLRNDDNVSQEDPQVSGMFQSDFPIHCKLNGLPIIGVKVLDGGSESTTDLPYWASITTEVSDDPNIRKLDQLTIRGWKITSPVLTSLQLSLKSHHVTSIILWETGLTSNLLKSLLEVLPQVQCKYLELGGSPLDDLHSIGEFISNCTSLIGLRLRCCEMSDDKLVPLCTALKKNPPLQQLDLSCNGIGDEGARELSKVLRVNNNLMVLSLTRNGIGDVGAVCLMQALKKFQLNHEEIIQRRQLLSQCLQQQWENLKKSDSTSRRSSSLDHRSNSRDKLAESHKKLSTGAMLKTTSFISKMKKGVETKKAAANAKGKGKGGSKDEGTVTPRDTPSRTARSVSISFNAASGPLIDGVEENEEGQIVSSGNLNIISLSLSNNKIGSSSLPLILQTLEYQTAVLKEKELEKPPGLMTIFLSGNLFPNDDAIYLAICDAIKARDPCLVTEQNEDNVAAESS